MKRLISLLLPAVVMMAACAPSQTITRYTVKVEQEYPHDTLSYTQGLFFDGDTLYESAGQYGESSLAMVDIETGVHVHGVWMDKRVFAEGSCNIGDDIYVLTWLEGICMVFDKKDLTMTRQMKYKRQGWGLTTDGNQLIMSDGSAQLYFVNPKTFTTVRSITVRRNGKSVNMLNELEYIDGKIWANIYRKDEIVIIDPATGDVEGVIDCRGLLDKKLHTSRTDVLNGIALHKATGDIYLTGKYWPRMYRIALEQKK